MADRIVKVRYNGAPKTNPPEVRGIMPPPFGVWEKGDTREFTESWYKVHLPHQALSFQEFCVWLWGPQGAENVTRGRYEILSGLSKGYADQMVKGAKAGDDDTVAPGTELPVNTTTDQQPPEQVVDEGAK